MFPEESTGTTPVVRATKSSVTHSESRLLPTCDICSDNNDGNTEAFFLRRSTGTIIIRCFSSTLYNSVSFLNICCMGKVPYYSKDLHARAVVPRLAKMLEQTKKLPYIIFNLI